MLFCVDERSGEVTCVHSGGRRLNSNEGKYLKNYTETNWLAIQNDDFTPFFHVFNDSVEFLSDAQRFEEVSIKLNGEGGASFKSTVNLDAVPFASKLFYVKDIFPQAVIDQINGKEIWIEVQFKATTFPRMIVGNYDLKQDFHYITHSFGRVDTSDYIESRMPGEVSAFLPLLSASPLNLQARSYPTNSPCSIESKVYEYMPGSDDKNLICESYAFESRGGFINLFQNNSTTLKLYEIVGKCPSRLNVSYNYSLPTSRHPTDIATGFKSKDYPPKISHWGHGVCKRGFRTLILIRNISHSDMEQCVNSPVSIDIELFSLDFAQSVSIQIPASGWNYVEINPEEIPALGQEFFSWRFKDIVSTRMETFWISYNINTGAICGEHGF